jgi:surface protein
MARYNLHGYAWEINDNIWLIDSLNIRNGVIVDINGDSITIFMYDTMSNETFNSPTLHGTFGRAEVYKNTFLITPTPSISQSLSPTPTRTPKPSSTLTMTPTPSPVIYPNLLANTAWTTNNGTVVQTDILTKFISNNSGTQQVDFTSSPMTVTAGGNYKFNARFNEGACQYAIIEIYALTQSLTRSDIPLMSINVSNSDIFNVTNMSSGSFNYELLIPSGVTSIQVAISLYADSNYNMYAPNGYDYTIDNISLVKYVPYSPVPTPTPSAIAQTPYTIQFDSTGIVEVDADSGITLDWGDGSAIDTMSDATYILHTYGSVGTYIVKMYGDSSSISGYEQDGTVPPSNSKILSFGTYNVTSIVPPTSVYEVPSSIPTTLTDMSNMFNGASVFNQDISSWNTSAVTNMNSMFSGASAFNQDLSSWNTSAVTNMNNMFYDTSAFNQDLSSWDTSHVTDMSQMFQSASVFNQDIGTWNTSKVSNMSAMFANAEAFNQDLSHWCVTLISTLPADFDTNATAWTDARPVWGTCPA